MNEFTANIRRLTWTRQDVAHGALIRFKGCIDETFDIAALVNAPQKTLIFDLEGVDQITSFGIQEWRTAVSSLNCHELLYINVQPAMMTQFNSVPRFAGKGHIITFQAPYRCHSCQIDLTRVIDLRTESNIVTQETPPEVLCPQCQNLAEFDDIPSLYFLYVSRSQVPVISQTAARLLQEPVVSPAPLRVAKEILNDSTLLWVSGSLTFVRTLRRFLEGAEGDTLVFADDLTDVTAHTSHEFFKVLSNVHVPIWLSGVPSPFLLAAPLKPQHVHWVSARFELFCDLCNQNHQRTMSLPLNQQHAEQRCQIHKTPLQLKFPVEGLEEAQRANPLPSPKVMNLIRDAQAKPSPFIRTSLSIGRQEKLAGDANHFGKYLLLERLGTNHLMEVYRAKLRDNAKENNFVIVKRAIESLKRDRSFIDTFLAEQQMTSRLHHPNAFRILDFGEIEGRAFLVSEYLEGISLRTALARSKLNRTSMSLALSLFVAREIAAALNAAHNLHKETSSKLPLIHRELSPHSVFLTIDGDVKINDFGLGRSADFAQFTPAYASSGRLTYLAPEQIRSTASISDVRVDIFPIGLIFYYCATLEHMFEKDTEYGTMWALLNDTVRSLSERLPQVPPKLEEFLKKCLSRDSRLRYQTANDVLQDASALLQELTEDSGPSMLQAFLQSLGIPKTSS